MSKRREVGRDFVDLVLELGLHSVRWWMKRYVDVGRSLAALGDVNWMEKHESVSALSSKSVCCSCLCFIFIVSLFLSLFFVLSLSLSFFLFSLAVCLVVVYFFRLTLYCALMLFFVYMCDFFFFLGVHVYVCARDKRPPPISALVTSFYITAHSIEAKMHAAQTPGIAVQLSAIFILLVL